MNKQNVVQFARSEFNVAAADFAKTNPYNSLLRFYRRFDSAVAGAIQAAKFKPACHEGCAICCHYRVGARSLEILAIRQFVTQHFSQDQLQQLRQRVALNVEEAKGLSYAENLAINQRCAFLLENGSCSIYPVRPISCRSYHSTDFLVCNASYEEPSLNIPPNFIQELFEVENGMASGFHDASDEAGFDPRLYDLNSAFLEAMENPKASKRFKSRKKTFPSAKVVEEPDSEQVFPL